MKSFIINTTMGFPGLGNPTLFLSHRMNDGAEFILLVIYTLKRCFEDVFRSSTQHCFALIFCLLFTAPPTAASTNPSKTVIIGVPLNSPPFVYEGEGRGIEMDLVASVFKKMGYSIVWRHLPPKRIHHQVLQHEINVGMRTQPSMTNALYYSRPYIIFQNVAVAVDSGIELKKIQDLSKYNVVAFQNAKEFLGPEYVKAISGSSVYLELPNQAKQIETLFRRRSQVIIIERRIFSYFQEMFYPNSEVKIFEIFPPTPYTASFHDKNLRDEFDKALLVKTHQLFGN